MTAEAGRASPGIFIALDALVVERAEKPAALEEAAVGLRRVGWIGRPIILVDNRVAGRTLPSDSHDREAWVRATVGPGAYAVVAFEEPRVERGDDQAAIETWRAIAEAHGGTWLVTDRPRQVGPARQSGLRVVLIGPGDGQPRRQRPDYRARDLQDAIGHMLAADVFEHPAGQSSDESAPGFLIPRVP